MCVGQTSGGEGQIVPEGKSHKARPVGVELLDRGRGTTSPAILNHHPGRGLAAGLDSDLCGHVCRTSSRGPGRATHERLERDRLVGAADELIHLREEPAAGIREWTA